MGKNGRHGLFKNGSKRSRLYIIWGGTKAKCKRKNWIEKGITFCKEWDSFIDFMDWSLSHGYQDHLTLDRKNNSLGYSPDNCRWATMAEQQNNRDNNVFTTYQGRTQTIGQWANELGLFHGMLWWRHKRGDRGEKLFRPVRQYRPRDKSSKVEYPIRLRGLRSQIHQRCYNPNCKDYPRYGETGIRMCEEWLNHAPSFYQWAVDNGYQDHLTIDRKDPDGDYTPDNCRWVTRKKQNQNLRSNVRYNYQGEILCEAQVSRRMGVSHSTLYQRRIRGLTHRTEQQGAFLIT